MQRQEILTTRYGEMLDLISCLSVYNGQAEEKIKVKLGIDDIIKMQ